MHYGSATIKNALEAGQVEDAVMPSHTIKSSGRIVGAVPLAAAAEQFEMLARKGGDPAELDRLRIRMVKLFSRSLWPQSQFNKGLTHGYDYFSKRYPFISG